MAEKRLTRKTMSIKIATVLLNADKQLDETNWKVQDLMKRSVAELTDHYELAMKIDDTPLWDLSAEVDLDHEAWKKRNGLS